MASLVVQFCRGASKDVALVVLGLLPTTVHSTAVLARLMEAALQAYLNHVGLASLEADATTPNHPHGGGGGGGGAGASDAAAEAAADRAAVAAATVRAWGGAGLEGALPRSRSATCTALRSRRRRRCTRAKRRRRSTRRRRSGPSSS
mmetsp:Transcript_39579/g.104889  ORF Transcript_39579/g.104889 Transcript_39579/m.104889 type:complete len:147 (-) Transcript_39579:480-920(-)